jgi:hypothetical protein
VVSDPAPAVSRRSIVLLAAGSAAAALGGCSTKPTPSNVPLSRHTQGAAADVELLTGLLGLEHYAIAAYAAGLPLLPRGNSRVAKQFLGHELAHVAELEGLIQQAGRKPPKPPAFYDLGQPRDEREVLELLHAAEHAQLRGYLDAIPRLSPPRLRAAVAAIVGNEAQHTAVLRSLLGLAPVPAALVTGTE